MKLHHLVGGVSVSGLAWLMLSLTATDAAHAQLSLQQNATHGRVEQHIILDSTYQRHRRLAIYTPPGYDSRKAGGYALLVMFDGLDHLQDSSFVTGLDSLSSMGLTPSLVSVLVDDSSFAVRLGDLANQPRMAKFVGDQLVPWARRNWNVTRDPAQTIIGGSSAGGLAAAYIAFMRPDLFGNVLSQSGAFWRGPAGINGPPYEWLAMQYQSAAKKSIRFLMDVGSRETGRVLGGSGPVFIDATRRFRDVLRARGYEVMYTEIPGGVHAPTTWAPRLPGDLVSLTRAWKKADP